MRCPECGGRKKKVDYTVGLGPHGLVPAYTNFPCPTCRGTGYIPEDEEQMAYRAGAHINTTVKKNNGRGLDTSAPGRAVPGHPDNVPSNIRVKYTGDYNFALPFSFIGRWLQKLKK